MQQTVFTKAVHPAVQVVLTQSNWTFGSRRLINRRTQPSVMPTLLITGGAGFIGGHTARMAIDFGWDVRILDDLSTGLESTVKDLQAMGAEFHQGDVRDPGVVLAAAFGCDAVVHFAAQVSVPRSVEQPEETMAVNVGGTENVILACRQNSIKRFVMASSAAVYGTNDEFPLDEADAGTFHSPYAESKWKNESQVRDAQIDGMEAVALRFFNVYGSGQRADGAYAAVIPKFIERALAGQAPTLFGDGQQTRDFIHVLDVAKAVLHLATEPWKKELRPVYNVCTQTEISLIRLISEIHLILKDIAPTIPRCAPNHGPERAGDIARSIGSNAQLVLDTNWTPGIEFSEGLRQQILATIQDV